MTGDVIRLQNGTLAADIACLGAELQSLRLSGVGEYLWQGDPAHWALRAPILFPITGRAPQGRVASGGVVAAMPIHGFASSLRFSRLHVDAHACVLRLCDSDETRAVYPHEFALTLRYRLRGARLQVGAVVENRGRGPMPFGFGLHPGFVWPLPGADGLAHDLRLVGANAPRPAALTGGFLAGGMLPSPFVGGQMPLLPGVFAQDASVLFPQGVGPALWYRAGNGAGVALRWRGFGHFVMWHPPGAGFLCLEPWQGLPPAPDAPPDIALRPGAVVLPPGQSARFALSVALIPPGV